MQVMSNGGISRGAPPPALPLLTLIGVSTGAGALAQALQPPGGGLPEGMGALVAVCGLALLVATYATARDVYPMATALTLYWVLVSVVYLAFHQYVIGAALMANAVVIGLARGRRDLARGR